MSLELDWSLVTEALVDQLRCRINTLLCEIDLPSYIGPLDLHTLELGSDPPELCVKNVSDIWREFREASTSAKRTDSNSNVRSMSDSLASLRAPIAPMRMRTFCQYDTESMPVSVHAESEMSDWGDDESILRWSETGSDAGMTDYSAMTGDVHETEKQNVLPTFQTHLQMEWVSDSVRVGFSTEFRIHQGDTAIVSLPANIMLTSMEFLAEIVIALDGDERCIYVTLCERDTEHREPCSYRKRHKASQIVPYLGFDSRVGEQSKHILENVGKVEKFLGDLVRQVLETELVFPNFYTIAMPDSR
ncbi:Mitochondrial distribution and morphology protein 12 [Malassezia yamatoensis]|uniref:Mitochondrial distribution and morphology protein 12 n=1 Tax=Malassezia yamatoensis TaxID=253288 RepID=A0AAJ5YPA3_9BASI|nr:Mitochondrial distribution and morphology protein 12 [Malassezia yamatoensis]